MKRPTEPAVAWGIKVGGSGHPPRLLEKLYLDRTAATRVAARRRYDIPFMTYRPVRVALVPLAIARAAGLLRKEKAE